MSAKKRRKVLKNDALTLIYENRDIPQNLVHTTERKGIRQSLIRWLHSFDIEYPRKRIDHFMPPFDRALQAIPSDWQKHWPEATEEFGILPKHLLHPRPIEHRADVAPDVGEGGFLLPAAGAGRLKFRDHNQFPSGLEKSLTKIFKTPELLATDHVLHRRRRPGSYEHAICAPRREHASKAA